MRASTVVIEDQASADLSVKNAIAVVTVTVTVIVIETATRIEIEIGTEIGIVSVIEIDA